MKKRGMIRRLLQILLPVLILAACLTACAGRGKSGEKTAESAAETAGQPASAAVQGAGQGAVQAAAQEAQQETEQEVSQGAEQEASQGAEQEVSQGTEQEASRGAEQEGAQETAGTAEEAAAETEPETEPEPTVVRHKQEGKHMVRAGNMTISVPTTFEGLEMEGAEFSGDDVLVRAGQKGSCRMKYRGAFNSIRINVTNNTDYDMAVRDCTIWGIEVASQEPDPELSLYGITMGATRQEIADVYGEPFSKTFDDENHMSNMVYQFGEDIHSNQIVMIIFKDKKAVAASYDDFDLVVR